MSPYLTQRIASLWLREASCPLRTKMYGGLPSSGGYQSNTEFEIGAQRIAESIHCILGSLGQRLVLADRFPERDFSRHELGHFREEIGIINKSMKEYSKPTYRTMLADHPYTIASVDSIRATSPQLRGTATSMKNSLRNGPEGIMVAARAAYDAAIALTYAMEKSVANYPGPITDPYRDGNLVSAVSKLSLAVKKLTD